MTAFLGWWDGDKKKPLPAKLAEALAAHERKYGRAATLALVNPEDAPHLADAPVTIQPAAHVPVNTFFVGEDKDTP